MINTILASTISQGDLTKIVQPILDFCDTLTLVLLPVVGALAAIWIILLCVKFSKADEPQEHDKAKKAIKNAVIGFVLIFILLIMLKVGLPILQDWWEGYSA